MKDIVIVGTGGFAKEVAFLIDNINKEKEEWNIRGFITNDEEKINIQHGKYIIFNTDRWLLNVNSSLYVAIGIGVPQLRAKLFTEYDENKKLIFPNLIHPNVVADIERIKFGKGNLICAGNIFTTDIEIGSNNLFNLDCTIGHDVKIGDSNVLNPSVNISGGVKIENNILLGTGVQILQYLSIHNNSIIGAGAVVCNNISEEGVYVGIPAKKIK